MGNERRPDINSVPAECVPFHLLSKREQQVLQCAADGDSLHETGKILGISAKTVEAHRSNIGRIGILRVYWHHAANHYSNHPVSTLSALIQDGIVNGYITHKLGEESIIPLTKRETEVFELVLQGMGRTEIRQKLSISRGTLDTHGGHIRAKLYTRTIYHTTARATYLKSRDMWPSPEDRSRKP